jgi:hypothetical protein
MIQKMLLQEGKELEFFINVFETVAFKELFGNGVDLQLPPRLPKQMVLAAFKSMMHPYFSDSVRRRCLEATGRVCYEMFLDYSKLSTDTDIDAFIRNLAGVFQDCMKIEKIREYVEIEYMPGTGNDLLPGECQCPLIRSKAVEPTSVWCICGRSFKKTMFEAVVKRPVEVLLSNSPLRTGSHTCQWLILLTPPGSRTRSPGIPDLIQ